MDNQYKYLAFSIQYVFRANFNDSYYLETVYVALEDLKKEGLKWIDPYHGRSKRNKTQVALKSYSDKEYVFLERTDGEIKEKTLQITDTYICCEDFNDSMLLASHINFKREKGNW